MGTAFTARGSDVNVRSGAFVVIPNPMLHRVPEEKEMKLCQPRTQEDDGRSTRTDIVPGLCIRPDPQQTNELDLPMDRQWIANGLPANGMPMRMQHSLAEWSRRWAP
ncbi:hypothetical protein E4U55_003300 [Claviceps digitariae]|nr:hypothetical protein E4U55_003300 [Claviceps digitariae]